MIMVVVGHDAADSGRKHRANTPKTNLETDSDSHSDKATGWLWYKDKRYEMQAKVSIY